MQTQKQIQNLKYGIKLKNIFGCFGSRSEQSMVNSQRLKVRQQGVAAIVTLLIISVAVLIMAHNSALLGLGELDMGYVSQKGAEALSVAEGCMDDTFRRLRLNSSYPGGSLTTSHGSCIMSIVSSVNNRVVTVIASTTDGYYKKIETDIDLSVDTIPTITLNSWQEVDN